MVKNKREKVLQLLNTLQEGINYINLNIDKDYKFMTEISFEAINTIEYTLNQSKRSDNKIDKLVKDIKKDIYNLDNIISDTSQAINVCNRLIDNIQKAINMAESRLNEKINVVFMPYNAYMWNSLESIWKEAMKDEECNCYVVPIPYYKFIERKDGTTESIFTYEGNMLPDYVEIIDYKQFDLAIVNPDIIYIHNQYDDCNNATRVQSDYFSYNLKKYTNHLVYSTYGILGSYPVSFYNGFYSFIASRNFDKVIVQSPAFKVIAEYSGVNKDSILALGSPKFDALINSLNNEDNNKELKEKFKNKTVFLWTTNLMKIINGKDKVLDEIENLFELIKKSDNYALIYRPHPLELTYVKSKVPQCFNRYISLLESIKESDNIILDENSSYYEAFNISDALITDRSSVLIEYMATGKPVLIYDIDLKREYYSDKVFDIFSNYIVGEEGMTVEKFIDLVINKNDINKLKRLKALETVLTNIDGSSGEKIYRKVKNDVMINYY